jgi:hypothetical protein
LLSFVAGELLRSSRHTVGTCVTVLSDGHVEIEKKISNRVQTCPAKNGDFSKKTRKGPMALDHC